MATSPATRVRDDAQPDDLDIPLSHREVETTLRAVETTTDAVDAQARLVHHMIVSTAVAIPIMVAFWVGIVALAVSFTDVGFGAPILMGVAVGVLAGVFWGTWAGFVFYSHAQEAQRRFNSNTRVR